MTRERIQINVDAEDNASDTLDQVADAAEGLEGADPEVEVSADDQASGDLDEVEGAVEDLDGQSAEVDATADDQASGELEDVEGAVDDLDGQTATVEADADDNATDALEDVESTVASLDGQTATVSAEADVGEANAALGGFGGQLGMLRERASGLASQLSGAGPLAIAGGASVAGAALGAFAIKSVTEYTDMALAAQDFATATGLSVEESSRWLSLAGDLQVEGGALESVLGRLNREAGQNAQKFAEYGIELGRTADGGIDARETLLNVLSALEATEDPARRATIAQDLLGRQYQSLGQILNMTRQELQAELDATNEWEIVTGEAADRAREFSRSLDQARDNVNSVALELGQVLVPALNEALSGFNLVAEATRAPQDDGGFDGFIKGAVEGLRDWVFQGTKDAQAWSSIWENAFGQAEDDNAAFARSQAVAARQTADAWVAAEGDITSGLDHIQEGHEDAARAVGFAADAVGTTFVQAAEDAREEAAELADESQRLIDVMDGLAGSSLNVEAAQDAWAETLAEVSEELEAATEGAEDNEEAARAQRTVIRQATQDADRLADALRDDAAAQAEAEGATLSATAKLDVWNQSMLDSAASAEGPLRDAILGYIADANGIPASKVTEISAAIERGDLAEAERLINDASRARTAAITADANTTQAEIDLEHLVREREARIRTTVVAPGTRSVFAAGGTSSGGTALVGEQGPELVDLPAGAHVSSAASTRGRLAGRGGDTYHQTITINARQPIDTTIEQLRSWTRRNGELRIS